VEPVSLFSLRSPDQDDRGAILYAAGSKVGFVRARLIEAQYSCSAGFLIIASCDVPYEEELDISLRAKVSFNLLDEMMLGLPYTPGIFGGVVMSGPNMLEFSFFGRDRWIVEVFDRPRIVWVKNWFGPARYASCLPGRHFLRLRRAKER
jgi:hypothetical protein